MTTDPRAWLAQIKADNRARVDVPALVAALEAVLRALTDIENGRVPGGPAVHIEYIEDAIAAHIPTEEA